VKIFDYLVHALDLGYSADVHCPVALGAHESLFEIPRFTGLREDGRVGFHEGLSVGVRANDWVLFSWPPHYEQLARGMSPDAPHERVIHLVQGTRHANAAFADGYALRLLARPMARIMVSDEVMEACAPHLNGESACKTILDAHDWGFFHRRRDGGLPPVIRVGYTTWKSDAGMEVERISRERGDQRFEFRSLRGRASWEEIRELLHASDVFLCFPGPEEGFYLPGLEAFAAGAIVVVPDVGGNRAYCRFGENCVQVGYEEPSEYVAALDRLAGSTPAIVAELRTEGYATLERHTLEREGAEFAEFLIELSGRAGARASLARSRDAREMARAGGAP
jgi:glycosyltransferase involved in cell wall biosynthesis